MFITLGIYHGLVETRFNHQIPENLVRKAYTGRYIAHMVLLTFLTFIDIHV